MTKPYEAPTRATSSARVEALEAQVGELVDLLATAPSKEVEPEPDAEPKRRTRKPKGASAA